MIGSLHRRGFTKRAAKPAAGEVRPRIAAFAGRMGIHRMPMHGRPAGGKKVEVPGF